MPVILSEGEACNPEPQAKEEPVILSEAKDLSDIEILRFAQDHKQAHGAAFYDSG